MGDIVSQTAAIEGVFGGKAEKWGNLPCRFGGIRLICYNAGVKMEKGRPIVFPLCRRFCGFRGLARRAVFACALAFAVFAVQLAALSGEAFAQVPGDSECSDAGWKSSVPVGGSTCIINTQAGEGASFDWCYLRNTPANKYSCSDVFGPSFAFPQAPAPLPEDAADRPRYVFNCDPAGTKGLLPATFNISGATACACAPGTTRSGDRCVCDAAGHIFADGACRCPAGQGALDSGACGVCTGGKSAPEGGACACPGGPSFEIDGVCIDPVSPYDPVNVSKPAGPLVFDPRYPGDFDLPNNVIRVRWGRPLNIGGGKIMEYRVRTQRSVPGIVARTGAASDPARCNVLRDDHWAAPASTYTNISHNVFQTTFRNLARDVCWRFYVSARNAAGWGAEVATNPIMNRAAQEGAAVGCSTYEGRAWDGSNDNGYAEHLGCRSVRMIDNLDWCHRQGNRYYRKDYRVRESPYDENPIYRGHLCFSETEAVPCGPFRGFTINDYQVGSIVYDRDTICHLNERDQCGGGREYDIVQRECICRGHAGRTGNAHCSCGVANADARCHCTGGTVYHPDTNICGYAPWTESFLRVSPGSGALRSARLTVRLRLFAKTPTDYFPEGGVFNVYAGDSTVPLRGDCRNVPLQLIRVTLLSEEGDGSTRVVAGAVGTCSPELPHGTHRLRAEYSLEEKTRTRPSGNGFERTVCDLNCRARTRLRAVALPTALLTVGRDFRADCENPNQGLNPAGGEWQASNMQCNIRTEGNFFTQSGLFACAHGVAGVAECDEIFEKMRREKCLEGDDLVYKRAGAEPDFTCVCRQQGDIRDADGCRSAAEDLLIAELAKDSPDTGVIQAQVDAGARPDITSGGIALLALAVERGHAEAVSVLLTTGASPRTEVDGLRIPDYLTKNGLGVLDQHLTGTRLLSWPHAATILAHFRTGVAIAALTSSGGSYDWARTVSAQHPLAYLRERYDRTDDATDLAAMEVMGAIVLNGGATCVDLYAAVHPVCLRPSCSSEFAGYVCGDCPGKPHRSLDGDSCLAECREHEDVAGIGEGVWRLELECVCASGDAPGEDGTCAPRNNGLLLREIKKESPDLSRVRGLLDLGADPNYAPGGREILFDALEAGYADGVSVLITAGASPHIRGPRRRNVAELIMRNGLIGLVRTPLHSWQKAAELLTHFGDALSVLAMTSTVRYDWTATGRIYVMTGARFVHDNYSFPESDLGVIRSMSGYILEQGGYCPRNRATHPVCTSRPSCSGVGAVWSCRQQCDLARHRAQLSGGVCAASCAEGETLGDAADSWPDRVCVGAELESGPYIAEGQLPGSPRLSRPVEADFEGGRYRAHWGADSGAGRISDWRVRRSRSRAGATHPVAGGGMVSLTADSDPAACDFLAEGDWEFDGDYSFYGARAVSAWDSAASGRCYRWHISGRNAAGWSPEAVTDPILARPAATEKGACEAGETRSLLGECVADGLLQTADWCSRASSVAAVTLQAGGLCRVSFNRWSCDGRVPPYHDGSDTFCEGVNYCSSYSHYDSHHRACVCSGLAEFSRVQPTSMSRHHPSANLAGIRTCACNVEGATGGCLCPEGTVYHADLNACGPPHPEEVVFSAAKAELSTAEPAVVSLEIRDASGPAAGFFGVHLGDSERSLPGCSGVSLFAGAGRLAGGCAAYLPAGAHTLWAAHQLRCPGGCAVRAAGAVAPLTLLVTTAFAAECETANPGVNPLGGRLEGGACKIASVGNFYAIVNGELSCADADACAEIYAKLRETNCAGRGFWHRKADGDSPNDVENYECVCPFSGDPLDSDGQCKTTADNQMLAEIMKESPDLDAVLDQLGRGARADLKDAGIPALIIAATLGHAEVVSVLITAGADLNAQWAGNYIPELAAINGLDGDDAEKSVPWRRAGEVLNHFGGAAAIVAEHSPVEYNWGALRGDFHILARLAVGYDDFSQSDDERAVIRAMGGYALHQGAACPQDYAEHPVCAASLASCSGGDAAWSCRTCAGRPHLSSDGGACVAGCEVNEELQAGWAHSQCAASRSLDPYYPPIVASTTNLQAPRARGVSADFAAGTFHFEWDAPEDSGGGRIYGYRARRSQSRDGVTILAAAGGTATLTADSDPGACDSLTEADYEFSGDYVPYGPTVFAGSDSPPQGKCHRWHISARNAAGWGPESAATDAILARPSSTEKSACATGETWSLFGECVADGRLQTADWCARVKFIGAGASTLEEDGSCRIPLNNWNCDNRVIRTRDGGDTLCAGVNYCSSYSRYDSHHRACVCSGLAELSHTRPTALTRDHPSAHLPGLRTCACNIEGAVGGCFCPAGTVYHSDLRACGPPHPEEAVFSAADAEIGSSETAVLSLFIRDSNLPAGGLFNVYLEDSPTPLPDCADLPLSASGGALRGVCRTRLPAGENRLWAEHSLDCGGLDCGLRMTGIAVLAEVTVTSTFASECETVNPAVNPLGGQAAGGVCQINSAGNFYEVEGGGASCAEAGGECERAWAKIRRGGCVARGLVFLRAEAETVENDENYACVCPRDGGEADADGQCKTDADQALVAEILKESPDLATVSALLAGDARPDLISNGAPLAIIAATLGHAEAVSILITAGADPELRLAGRTIPEILVNGAAGLSWRRTAEVMIHFGDAVATAAITSSARYDWVRPSAELFGALALRHENPARTEEERRALETTAAYMLDQGGVCVSGHPVCLAQRICLNSLLTQESRHSCSRCDTPGVLSGSGLICAEFCNANEVLTTAWPENACVCAENFVRVRGRCVNVREQKPGLPWGVESALAGTEDKPRAVVSWNAPELAEDAPQLLDYLVWTRSAEAVSGSCVNADFGAEGYAEEDGLSLTLRTGSPRIQSLRLAFPASYGRCLRFAVAAVNEFGASEAAESPALHIQAAAQAAEKPRVALAGGAVSVSWKPLLRRRGADVRGFEILREVNDSGRFVSVAFLAAAVADADELLPKEQNLVDRIDLLLESSPATALRTAFERLRAAVYARRNGDGIFFTPIAGYDNSAHPIYDGEVYQRFTDLAMAAEYPGRLSANANGGYIRAVFDLMPVRADVSPVSILDENPPPGSTLRYRTRAVAPVAPGALSDASDIVKTSGAAADYDSLLMAEMSKKAPNITLVREHLLNGANPDIEATNGAPALIAAVKLARTDLVRALGVFGANLGAPSQPDSGRNAAHLLARNDGALSWTKALEMMLVFTDLAARPGASLDWSAVDDGGQTALGHLFASYSSAVGADRLTIERMANAMLEVGAACLDSFAGGLEHVICTGSPPPAVRDLTAAFGGARGVDVSLKWTPVAGVLPVTGYRFWRVSAEPPGDATNCELARLPAITAGSRPLDVSATTAVSAEDLSIEDLGYGRCYKYGAAALSGAEIGPIAESAGLYAQAPPVTMAAPNVNLSPDVIPVISWARLTHRARERRGSNVTGYEVERSLDGTAFSPLVTVAAREPLHRDESVTAGATYYYRVRAQSGAGHGGFSPTSDPVTIDAGDNECPVGHLPDQPGRSMQCVRVGDACGDPVDQEAWDFFGTGRDGKPFAGCGCRLQWDYLDLDAGKYCVRLGLPGVASENPANIRGVADACVDAGYQTTLAVIADAEGNELGREMRCLFPSQPLPFRDDAERLDHCIVGAQEHPADPRRDAESGLLEDAVFCHRVIPQLAGESSAVIPSGYSAQNPYGYDNCSEGKSYDAGRNACVKDCETAEHIDVGGVCVTRAGAVRLRDPLVSESASLRKICEDVFGGDVDSVNPVCSGIDKNGTFCLMGAAEAFPCEGLFKHVRTCNLLRRPAVNPFFCGAVCEAGETPRGKDCE